MHLAVLLYSVVWFNVAYKIVYTKLYYDSFLNL